MCPCTKACMKLNSVVKQELIYLLNTLLCLETRFSLRNLSCVLTTCSLSLDDQTLLEVLLKGRTF